MNPTTGPSTPAAELALVAQFDAFVEAVGGYGGQCATPPHVLAPSAAFEAQIKAMRLRLHKLDQMFTALVGSPAPDPDVAEHSIRSLIASLLGIGAEERSVIFLVRQLWLAGRDRHGDGVRQWMEVTDGDLTLRVLWSEEDRCWWAGLRDAKADARPVKFEPIAHGSTREDALAHLSIATYVGLMEDPVSEAAVEAVARNYVTAFGDGDRPCDAGERLLSLADRMALVRAGAALAIGAEPATPATPRETGACQYDCDRPYATGIACGMKRAESDRSWGRDTACGCSCHAVDNKTLLAMYEDQRSMEHAHKTSKLASHTRLAEIANATEQHILQRLDTANATPRPDAASASVTEAMLSKAWERYIMPAGYASTWDELSQRESDALRAFVAALAAAPSQRESGALQSLALEVNAINRANGWEGLTPEEWPNVRKVITLLALVMTEVAEAIEAVRKDDRSNFAEEMADTVIRCLDICGGLGIDLDAEVAAKLAKNRTRGHRHGGKRV